jgi:hypothetical protein
MQPDDLAWREDPSLGGAELLEPGPEVEAAVAARWMSGLHGEVEGTAAAEDVCSAGSLLRCARPDHPVDRQSVSANVRGVCRRTRRGIQTGGGRPPGCD